MNSSCDDSFCSDSEYLHLIEEIEKNAAASTQVKKSFFILTELCGGSRGYYLFVNLMIKYYL